MVSSVDYNPTEEQLEAECLTQIFGIVIRSDLSNFDKLGAIYHVLRSFYGDI